MILEHDLLTNPKSCHAFSGLAHTKRIIDVGCGIRPCPAFPCDEHICIEPHAEYVEHLTKWQPTDRKVLIVNGEVEKLADQPRSDTTVFLLDVIEHLEKERGVQIARLLEEFEHAVIFTPLGWHEQGDENPDRWGLNGGYWQKHRSAWQPEDFPNWKVRSWKRWNAENSGAILAIR